MTDGRHGVRGPGTGSPPTIMPRVQLFPDGPPGPAGQGNEHLALLDAQIARAGRWGWRYSRSVPGRHAAAGDSTPPRASPKYSRLPAGGAAVPPTTPATSTCSSAGSDAGSRYPSGVGQVQSGPVRGGGVTRLAATRARSPTAGSGTGWWCDVPRRPARTRRPSAGWQGAPLGNHDVRHDGAHPTPDHRGSSRRSRGRAGSRAGAGLHGRRRGGSRNWPSRTTPRCWRPDGRSPCGVLIYLGFLLAAGSALLPGQQGRAIHRRVGWWLAVSAVLNPLWIWPSPAVGGHRRAAADQPGRGARGRLPAAGQERADDGWVERSWRFPAAGGDLSGPGRGGARPGLTAGVTRSACRPTVPMPRAGGDPALVVLTAERALGDRLSVQLRRVRLKNGRVGELAGIAGERPAGRSDRRRDRGGGRRRAPGGAPDRPLGRAGPPRAR
ncbi:hypothetical protein HBB16_17355 [Pseudonocardia sp. MCCB 268]|nr:hypothetical protein [Pseudonocardia cytotoxica]